MVGRERAWNRVIVGRERMFWEGQEPPKGGWLWVWAGQVRARVWEVPPFPVLLQQPSDP